MARAVVTGGCGFVGSRLVERLVAQGDEVTVYDVGPLPPDLRCDPAAIRKVDADVRDADALAAAVTPGVDVVYHLAAMVGVDRYLDSPLDVIDVAVVGTRTLLGLAVDAGAAVVLASTSEVYGRNPRSPWAEDSDRVLGSTSTSRWSYSSSKATAEHMTFACADRYGLRAAIVRYFNVYGPRQRPAYVVSRTVHRVLRGLPPLLYDGGGQTRCFTFVDDAVAATVLAAERAAAGAGAECFNVGSERETTVGEVVRLVAEVAGRDLEPVPIRTELDLGSNYEDIPRRVPDTARARALLGWRCTTDLRAGLEQTVAWARRSPWWLACDEPPAAPSPRPEPDLAMTG
ncbi:MAG TPA: NAD-dependent epimerase/dehydratase family protein [Solirubrobacteraceae bacterium]|jgi:UDP-glucose 4-epimerase|nr:NAD-dependent epimerase/dehydratase family protein [Solirubrobacteraceae bacterium]